LKVCLGHYHQDVQESISSTFYARLLCQYFGAKILQSQNVIREKLREALLYEKRQQKMLMKFDYMLPSLSVIRGLEILRFKNANIGK